jgi:hypothetical protein
MEHNYLGVVSASPPEQATIKDLAYQAIDWMSVRLGITPSKPFPAVVFSRVSHYDLPNNQIGLNPYLLLQGRRVDVHEAAHCVLAWAQPELVKQTQQGIRSSAFYDELTALYAELEFGRIPLSTQVKAELSKVPKLHLFSTGMYADPLTIGEKSLAGARQLWRGDQHALRKLVGTEESMVALLEHHRVPHLSEFFQGREPSDVF